MTRDDDLSAISLRKRAARAEARLLRELAARTSPGASAELCRRLAAELRPVPGTVVSGYWPIGTELDVLPALRHFALGGCVTALPVSLGRGSPLLFRAWSPGDALVEGEFGIMVPAPGAPEVEPEVVLVPMLAFDRSGGRLGYGAGFYDRTLDRLRGRGRVLAVGVAYSGQEMPAVPLDPYDQPLDRLVTERFSLSFTPAAGGTSDRTEDGRPSR